MDALKQVFEFICFGCFIVVSVIALLLGITLVCSLLLWAFQGNPRTFAAGVVIILVLLGALRGLWRTELL